MYTFFKTTTKLRWIRMCLYVHFLFMILYVVRNDEIKKGSIMSSFSHGKIDWVSLTTKNKGLTRLYRSITAIDPLSWSPSWSHQWHKREIHHADDVKRELRANPSCLLASQRWELTVGQSCRQICTTSYRKISWCLEAPIFGSIHSTFQSLWYLTSAAALPRCLSNFRAIRSL